MARLALSIESKAYRHSNGEFAWRPGDINEALAEMVRANLACLGGELWMVKDGVVAPWFNSDESAPATFFGWDTGSRNRDETWADYIIRCHRESMVAVASLRTEEVCYPEGELFFNLKFVTEAELRDLP